MTNSQVLFTFAGSVPSTLPNKATNGSAGYDIYAAIGTPFDLNPGSTVAIPAGFRVALPQNMVMLLISRSGLAVHHNVVLANQMGVIDSDYRGEVKVVLRNLDRITYTIRPQERIAQALFLPVFSPDFHITHELPPTIRGEGGFGSTGRH